MIDNIIIRDIPTIRNDIRNLYKQDDLNGLLSMFQPCVYKPYDYRIENLPDNLHLLIFYIYVKKVMKYYKLETFEKTIKELFKSFIKLVSFVSIPYILNRLAKALAPQLPS